MFFIGRLVSPNYDTFTCYTLDPFIKHIDHKIIHTMNQITDNSPFNEIWDEMLSGREYYALHPALTSLLTLTRDKIRDFNDIRPTDIASLEKALRDILGSCGKNPTVNQPFRCDYGANIHIGDNFFANFNLTILDEGKVTIGDNVFIGPNVSIYTACHPLDPKRRNEGYEWSEPVTIGNNVWIGGNTVLLPGVSIGDDTTIGAGSVVTRPIPPNVIAVGNPCRVLRPIKPEE